MLLNECTLLIKTYMNSSFTYMCVCKPFSLSHPVCSSVNNIFIDFKMSLTCKCTIILDIIKKEKK